MTKLYTFNNKNKWSEDIIQRNTNWVISKENMKWKDQMYNSNYVWLYRVFLSKRSKIFSQELEKIESVYFRNLLIIYKEVVAAADERIKIQGEDKVKTSRIREITSHYRGFRRGKFLNDNVDVFNSILTNKGKENLEEYYLKLLGDNFKNRSLYNLLNINNKLGVGYSLKQMGLKQVTDEKYNNIVSRKMENRLTIPHYFFPSRYITRSNILPQTRNWPNSIYSFIKSTIVNIKYTDLMATEFIKVFLDPKLLKRKVVKSYFSEWKVFAGMSIVPLKLFGKFMNELIKFTSQRSQVELKNILRFNSNILSLPWVKKELAWAKIFRKIFKSRREKFARGFTPKRTAIFSQKRNIWLSKPLFIHTPSNVIIDLYLFTNKSYKLSKYHHMIKVRAIYKYMYSMYANYDQIIQNIISRPRIFYINIIDPKMHEYYSRVIRSYENALIHFSKSQFMNLLINLLKWNLSNKLITYLLPSLIGPKLNSKEPDISPNSNIINHKESKFNAIEELSNNNISNSLLPLITNKDNNEIYKGSNSSPFGIRVSDNSNKRTAKYIPLNWNTTSNNVNRYIFRSLNLNSKISKYRSIYNNEKKNIFINDYITLISNDVYKIEKNKERNLSWWKNEYYLLKELGPRYNSKVMAKLREKELETNALIPLKFEDYPNWSKELILNQKKKYKKKSRRVKIFGLDKYSLRKYKWNLKKGKKWSTLSPEFWDKQMEKYNTFSKAQKADTDPTQKWVYDNKTRLKVHISKYQADNSIFDKIKKRRKLKNKLILKGKLGKYNLSSINLNYKSVKNQTNKKINQSQNKNKNKDQSLFNNINSFDLKINVKNSKIAYSSLQSKSDNINTKSSQFETNEKNHDVKIGTKRVAWISNNAKNISSQNKSVPFKKGRKSQGRHENNSIFPSWNIHDAINAHLNDVRIKNNKNNSRLSDLDSKFGSSGNKRKIHTLRSISNIENKYFKSTNYINNQIKQDKLVIKKSHSLNILLQMLRNGRINKEWVINKMNILNISEINNDIILNINKELNKNEIIKYTLADGATLSAQENKDNTQIIKDEYVNSWNLLYGNWNLSKFDNLFDSKGKVIKRINKIRQKRNYIKYIKDTYKNNKLARYKKLNFKVMANNILQNNEISIKSVLNLMLDRHKKKWDKFDKSVIRMILILIMGSSKRRYNNKIETYLKLRRQDIGRGRVNTKKKIKMQLTLGKNTAGNLSKRDKKMNKKIETNYKKYLRYSYAKLFETIKNKFINNDKLYIDVLRQEFYKINRDVIVSKTTENFSYESNTLNNSHEFGYYSNGINTKFTMAWNEISQFSFKLWQTLNFNKREENIMHILSFSDKAIKPYYRYMIRLFILGEYRKFLNRLGFKSIILHLNLPFHFIGGSRFDWIKDNSLKIFNFIAVRTLFNIFKYNYRSLYVLKPKFYHINKFRLYKRKAKRLNFNTWLRSIRYLKSLRKAPNSYWLRYHKLVSIYYQKIISFAKWDTEKRVLMPYVLYFEDLLYNIYGKLALVRIWPLKRYYLSIYILAERLMLLLDKSAHRKKRRKNLKHVFTGFVLDFLNIINKTKIEKIYEANLGSNTRWPTELITEVNKNLPLASNYNKLEYFSKKLYLPYLLNSYVMKYGQLDDYLNIPNFDYSRLVNDQHPDKPWINMIKWNFDLNFKKGYMKYWTRPIKNMFIDMNRTQDIKGYLFKFVGRAKGIQRKFGIWHQWGSFTGARHYNKLTYKYITLSTTHIRNSVRATMDHTQKSGIFPAGASNIKVWYSSLLSSDIMELIFYMLKKKVIYNALMKRNFLVHKNLEYFLHYNKWTDVNTGPMFSKLSYLKYKMKRWYKKHNKRNKRNPHLNFGITVKNRFIKNLRRNYNNRIFQIKSAILLKKKININK
jgi:hypothetical protein